MSYLAIKSYVSEQVELSTTKVMQLLRYMQTYKVSKGYQWIKSLGNPASQKSKTKILEYF